MDEDPTVAFKWLIQEITEPANRSHAAIAVVDFVDSTGRKTRSHSETLELAHILFHNLLAARGVRNGAAVKFTGDGCILSYKVDEGLDLATACLHAIDDLTRFSGDITTVNNLLRKPSDNRGWGIWTKCALHVGNVVFVNYSHLYCIGSTDSEFGTYLPSLECDLVSIPFDAHGQAIDLACRVLNHCKTGQILASEDFVNSIDMSILPNNYRIQIDSGPTEIDAKGAADGKLRVYEVVTEGANTMGVSSERIITGEQIDLLALLKNVDEALQYLDQHFLGAGIKKSLEDLVKLMDERTDILDGRDRSTLSLIAWKVVETLYVPATPKSVGLSGPPILQADLTGASHGDIVFGFPNFMRKLSLEIPEYDEVVSRARSDYFAGKDAYEQEKKTNIRETRDSFISRSWKSDSPWRECVRRSLRVYEEFVDKQTLLRSETDRQMRILLGLPVAHVNQ